MDKLRALQYFVAAAEEQSFSGAARRLEVSVPAVAKLVGSLERHLGARLFERTPHGLTLTGDGEGYFDACQPLLERLVVADETMMGSGAKARGVIVVGAPPQLAQHCLVPALPRFHVRYPDVQIDMRIVNRTSGLEPGAVDVYVLLGWPECPELVQRRIAETRLLTCAAPAYLAAHGAPARPRDLEGHPCFLFRNPRGMVVDLWQYKRGEERESVTVRGWLVSDHRDLVLDAVHAGQGFGRFTDVTIRPHLRGRALVPVLPEWEMEHPPPVHLLHAPGRQRTPRVRLFIDFVSGLFRELAAEREGVQFSRDPADRPYWHRRHLGRASAALRGR